MSLTLLGVVLMDGQASLMLFRVASMITNVAPKTGSKVLDRVLNQTVGSRRFLKYQARLNRDRLAGIESPDNILIVADLNIGDAILTQSCVSAVRDFFPTARIDYVIGRAAAALVTENAEVTNVFPLFRHAPQPSAGDINRLGCAMSEFPYDIVFNFCPYVGRHWLAQHVPTVVDYTYLAGQMVAGNDRGTSICHIMYCIHRFMHILFRPRWSPSRSRLFRGVNLTLSRTASRQAEEFLQAKNLAHEQSLHLYNPDASSRFTRLPLAEQVSLLEGLSTLPGSGLLAAGHSWPGIEHILLAQLSPQARAHWTLVPRTMSIDAFAALIDHCQLYLSPDTGQLHLAAARKQSACGSRRFRNKTAVWGIFGATPGRLYGYDSKRTGYMAANQDAPSRIYTGTPTCRNLTCINKAAKTCPNVHCFDHLSVANIIADAHAYIDPTLALEAEPVVLRSIASAM